jgi:hypothetical protein
MGGIVFNVSGASGEGVYVQETNTVLIELGIM